MTELLLHEIAVPTWLFWLMCAAFGFSIGYFGRELFYKITGI